jgi:hypothetical protein
MGYNENRGIGKKPKNQLTDILVLKPRPKGLGLGAEQPEDEKEKEVLEIGDRVLVVGMCIRDWLGLLLAFMRIRHMWTFSCSLVYLKLRYRQHS